MKSLLPARCISATRLDRAQRDKASATQILARLLDIEVQATRGGSFYLHAASAPKGNPFRAIN